ncbi:MAG: hypothetical protein H7Z20_08200 [Bdellovibrio sp.]|nr:hypothetical protein [Methylotenera sp.]
MSRYFSHFFAWILLLLIPLQGIAAANISICNSMMQAQMSEHQSINKPCHMANMHMASVTKTQDSCKHNTACKTNCATLCASLCGMTALTQTIHSMLELIGSQAIVAHNETYTSHSPPNLQRPPILLA